MFGVPGAKLAASPKKDATASISVNGRLTVGN